MYAIFNASYFSFYVNSGWSIFAIIQLQIYAITEAFFQKKKCMICALEHSSFLVFTYCPVKTWATNIVNVVLILLFKRWNNVRRIRWLNFNFQTNSNVKIMLMKVDDQYCFNTDSKLMCLLGKNKPHLNDPI